MGQNPRKPTAADQGEEGAAAAGEGSVDPQGADTRITPTKDFTTISRISREEDEKMT